MSPRITLALLGTVVSLASVAEASPRSREVEATPIYRRSFYSSTSGTKTFATINLRSNPELGCGTPDTILVVTRPDGTELMNDNCSTGNRNSCVVTSSGPGSWMVTVFAQKESAMQPTGGAMAMAAVAPPVPLTTHCGIADVTVSGAVLDRNVTFGGALVDAGVSGTFRAQTAHLPNGADDTVLLAYSASWQELGYDNDSGVGRAAGKTLALTGTSKLVVGSFSAAASGRAALILDDCTSNPDSITSCSVARDRDGDSLSNALEAELGTNPDHHDTDRDGIFDYYEVIGRQLVTAEQELRRFGANPRRRDLFIELDREVNDQGDIGTLFTQAELDLRVEDPYLDLPGLPPAPDGSRLIAVHIDRGEPCNARPTLCGDWGYATPVANTFLELVDAGYPSFPLVRRGLFHYGFITTGGAGQAFGTTFYAQTISGIPHETGHNLGLGHNGGPDQPHLNSKPNYPSLMNYAFQEWLPGLATQRGRFSEGRLPSMDDGLDEVTYDDGVDVKHLAASDWNLPVVNGAIDFNHDGRREGRVRADVAPEYRGTSGYDAWPHMQDAVDVGAAASETSCVEVAGACRPTGGSALATFALGGGATWIAAFTPYEHDDGLVYPDLRQTIENGGGSEWWSAEPGVAIDGDPVGEPAAAMFENAQNVMSALLVFPARDGRLHYRVVDLGRPDVGAWGPIPWLPAGTSVRNVSLATEGGEVVAVWRDFSRSDQSSNLFMARFDLAGQTWSVPEELAIMSLATPGLAAANDGTLYLAVPTAGTELSIRLWRRGPGQTTFVRVSDNGADWDVPVSANAGMRPRVSMEFVPLLEADGQALQDASGQLHMFWAGFDSDLSNRGERVFYRALRSGHLSAAGLTTGRWVIRKDGSGDRPEPGHSIGTAMRDGDVIAMYSATSWDATGDQPAGALRAPRYLPYAFAMPPAYEGLLDHDDASVIAQQMCNALWQLPSGSNAQADCRCARGVACAASAAESEVPLCGPE